MSVRGKLTAVFQSLTIRNYRLFTIGQLFKLNGVWLQFIAQDWLVLELSHNSASALGLVTGLQFLPVALLTLYAGKLADRYDKRRLLIAAHVVYAAMGLVMGALVTTHTITLTLVFVIAAVMGTANAIENPVRQAFVAELVEPTLLPNALGLMGANFNTARTVGPAVAGLAIWLLGLGPVFLFTVVLFLIPLAFLLRIDRARLYRDGKPPTRVRVLDGMTYVRRREDLLLPLFLMFVIGMLGFNVQITLALMAKAVFQTGPQQFGLLTTALSIGALAGALNSGRRRARPSAYTVLGYGFAFGALETLAAFGPSFWLTALLLLPTGFAMIGFAQACNQRIQLGVDSAYRGRVVALYMLMLLGTTPIGGPLIGYAAQHLGPRSGLWIGGVAGVAAVLIGLVLHRRFGGERLRVRLRPMPRLEVVSTRLDPESARLAQVS